MTDTKPAGSNTVQALWLGLGSISSYALSLISVVILSRYFEKPEYGTYRQIIYVYNTLLVVFSAGLPRVYAYFLPRTELAQGKDVVVKISRLLFLSGAAFSVVLFVFSGLIAKLLKNPELERGLRLFSPIPMMLLPTLGIEGIFSTYQKAHLIAVYNVLTRLFMLLCIVGPVILFHGTYVQAIYGWLAASLLCLLLAVYFQNLPFRGARHEKTSLGYKEIFSYSLPIAAASVWGIAIKAADQFFISRYFGPGVFADFSNGFMELPFVAMVSAATFTVLMPVFSKMVYDKSDVDNIVVLWRNAFLKSAIVIYPLVIFCIPNARRLMILLYSDRYASSAIYFQISMAANFFNIIVFGSLLFAMGRTKFYSQVHMYMAAGEWLAGYLVIVAVGSPVAIAVLSVALTIVKIWIFIAYISRQISIGFFKLFPVGKLLPIVLHSAVVLAAAQFLVSRVLPGLDNFAALSVTFSAFALILLLTARLAGLDYLLVLKPIKDRLLGSA